MRTFFEAALLPDLLALKRKPATISAIYTAIGHWEHRTTDPVLFDITNSMMAAWKKRMEEDGLAAGSINKYWRCLREIMRRAGQPTDRWNPLGLGLLGRVPYMTPAEGDVTEKGRFLPDEEIAVLYESCDSVRQGRHVAVDRRALLRLAIVLERTYGPSTRDLFALPCSSVSYERWHPDPNVLVEAPLGWLSYKRAKTGVAVVVPLSVPARRHLEAAGVDPARPGGVTIFPESFVKSNNVLYRSWNSITATARERLRLRNASRPLPPDDARFKDFRFTANTLWKRLHQVLDLGKFVVGHRTKDVNEQHYTEKAESIVKRLFLPPEATDLDRHFAWHELPVFLASPKRERTLFD